MTRRAAGDVARSFSVAVAALQAGVAIAAVALHPVVVAALIAILPDRERATRSA